MKTVLLILFLSLVCNLICADKLENFEFRLVLTILSKLSFIQSFNIGILNLINLEFLN